MAGTEISQHRPSPSIGAQLSESDKKRLGEYEAMALASDPRNVFMYLKTAKPVDGHKQEKCLEYVLRNLERSGIDNWGVVFKDDENYPKQLLDAKDELQYFYYQGNLDLLKEPMVSVVGTRRATKKGLETTDKLVRGLVKKGYTIVSGLAKGIDSRAHKSAIESKGNTVAVIGNPLWKYYPKENERVQRYIGEKFLVISQVPVNLYSKTNAWDGKYGTFLLARNITMAALSEATIVMEGDTTSGAYAQARQALEMERKVLIHKNVFDKDAVRRKSFDKVEKELEKITTYHEKISKQIEGISVFHQDLSKLYELVDLGNEKNDQAKAIIKKSTEKPNRPEALKEKGAIVVKNNQEAFKALKRKEHTDTLFEG